MNGLYRLISSVANALAALYRWVTALQEFRPDPYYLSRYTAWTEQLVVPAPVRAEPVSLVKQPNLVRRYVVEIGPCAPAGDWRGHPVRRAVGRVTVPLVHSWSRVDIKKPFVAAMKLPGSDWYRNVDELGLPRERMADTDTPTMGIFDQVVEAWRVRTGSRDVSWA
jgi:hypothetical protein